MKITAACIDHSLKYEIKTRVEFIAKAAEIANEAEKVGYDDMRGKKRWILLMLKRVLSHRSRSPC
ncbi:MAG: hypothetical protein L7F78_14120 [Syntrophales bacterium LBB04]|nr:hypothetical protein [Syntrophales bacterium LBB04]